MVPFMPWTYGDYDTSAIHIICLALWSS